MGTREEKIVGCLLGTAAGDALGLPCEGLGPARAARMFPDCGRHHFLFGKGMVSDDTEHACFVAKAMIEANGDPEIFQKRLARSLRWWLLGLPAGVGFATLRSILKLWAGFNPRKSGVFSAGNGPAMRSPIIGAACGADKSMLREFVARSTEITHRDPKAVYGALAVAAAAHMGATSPVVSGERFLEELPGYFGGWKDDAGGFGSCFGHESAEGGREASWYAFQREALERGGRGGENMAEIKTRPDACDFFKLMEKAAESAGKDEPVAEFAKSIGSRRGISGYVYHTVPCVIQVWLKQPDDFERALREIISAGGDTDTAGAILGGIMGARLGKQAIPEQWLDKIMEWPRTTRWMERLGIALSKSLEGDREITPPGYFVPGVVFRNLFFFLVVLAHGFRRLGPPYG